MDMDTSRTLTKVLGKRDIDKIPSDVLKKLEKYCENNNEQFIQTKVLYNTTQKNIEKLRKEYEKLLSTTQDTTAKKDAAQVNVTELRHQLDTANAEVARLTKQVANQEAETTVYRKECNQLIDEKDQLMKTSDGKDITINHLQSDLKSLRTELKSAVSEKNDAITRFAEMAAKEQSMDDREKRMEKEIERLTNEIVKMTENYNKSSSELATAKQFNTSATAQLEIDLKEKIEELSIADFTIRQLTESNQQLTNQRDTETVQLKNQLNESVALMEHYKRELDAKIRLVDLHKANFDECKAQTTEVRLEAESLSQTVQETTEKCKQLEKKLSDLGKQHQLELTEKDGTIAELRKELELAGEQLKTAETEHLEKMLEEKFPRAAASNRMLTNNLSLTEIYSRYHDSLADVHRLDVECLQLNTKVECLTIQLQETTTEFERQQIEYRKILKLNEEMTQQMDVVVAEQDGLREKFNEVSLKLANVECENIRLTSTQKDLARQICNLLNKVEKNGDELSPDQQQLKRLGLTNESIRKELVTFDNIVELQENNQKLILKVRELSNKVEKLEQQNIGMKSYEDKISYLERRLSDVEQARQANEEILSMTSKQKERFKQLYYDAMSYMGKQTIPDEVMDSAASNASPSPQNVTANGKDKRLLEVELKLQERVKELKVLKEEHNEYRKQATINFDMLKEQCETVERKVIELQSSNSKLQSHANFTSEQMKSHQSSIAIYKKQIQILEERNQMYDKTIAKHELANKQLKEEAWNTFMQLSTAENRCGHLELECRRLLEAKKNLETENNAFHRQKMTQGILESSRELVKLTSERSDFEGRILMEKQSEDHMRASRSNIQKLKQEQERLYAENASLQRSKETSIRKLMEEQSQSNDLQSKLSEARELIEVKNRQIFDLSEKLQAAFTTTHLDASLSNKNRSSKDLEVQVKIKTAEIEQLNMELRECAAKIKLLKSDWDAETNVLKSDLETLRVSESNSKSHINELQQEIRILSTKTLNPDTENKIQFERKTFAEKIAEKNKQIQELCQQSQQLKDKLLIVEKNYADVLSTHSVDLQMSVSRKIELNSCHEQIHQLKLAKDQAENLLKAIELDWDTTSKKYNEDRQEFERKIEVLEKQTMDLVDLMQTQRCQFPPSNGNIAGSSTMDQKTTDEKLDQHSSESLFGVVKYLRREKDIAVAQNESLSIENTRLLTELDMQRKRVEELSVQLNSTKLLIHEEPHVHVVSSTENEDLRRNVDTLNAVTDSNIHLRAENEDMLNKVRDLTSKLAAVETQLLELQKLNPQLVEKEKQMANENAMLRLNVDLLTRKSNALQNECENSAKMMADEKENLRQVNEQLNLKIAEMCRLKQEIDSKDQDLHVFEEYRKSFTQEIAEKNDHIVKNEDSESATTSQAVGQKRRLDSEESSVSVTSSQRKKRTRLGSQNVSAEYQVAESNVLAVDNKEDVEKAMTECFDAGNSEEHNIDDTDDVSKGHSDITDSLNQSPAMTASAKPNTSRIRPRVNSGESVKEVEVDPNENRSHEVSAEQEKAPQVETPIPPDNTKGRRGRLAKRRLERK